MKNRGFGLVEAIVAISIVASFIVLLTSINTLYLKVALGEGYQVQAGFLAEEGIEAVKLLRDDNWASKIAPLSRGVPYYLVFNGANYELTLTQTPIGIFDRQIVFSDVYRDASDNIAASGTLDPDTLLVVSTVNWSDRGAAKSKSVSTYITNLFGDRP